MAAIEVADDITCTRNGWVFVFEEFILILNAVNGDPLVVKYCHVVEMASLLYNEML